MKKGGVPDLHSVIPSRREFFEESGKCGHEVAPPREVRLTEAGKLKDEQSGAVPDGLAGAEEGMFEEFGIEKVRICCTAAGAKAREVGKPLHGDVAGDLE